MDDNFRICKTCNRNLPITEYSLDHNRPKLHCKECIRLKNKQRYFEAGRDKQLAKAKTGRELFKRQCIDYLGGKCSACGYNKCIAALDIHHIDPAQKEGRIKRNIAGLRKKDIEELDKCILLCANCHREHHYKSSS